MAVSHRTVNPAQKVNKLVRIQSAPPYYKFKLSLAQSSRALRLGRRGPGSEASMGDHFNADIAQLVEHFVANEDVTSSRLVIRSIFVLAV